MFASKKHNNIFVLSCIVFPFILELFVINPRVSIVVLGYLAVLGVLLIHYDIHTFDKHKLPFRSAYLEHMHLPFFEKHSHSLLKGLFRRFHHFIKPKYIPYHFQFLIQPTFLYWSIISLIFFYANPWFVQTLIVVATFCFMVILGNISGIYRKKFKIEEKHLHLFSITKIVIVFMSLFASAGYYFFGFISPYQTMILVLAVSFTLLYNYAWKTGKLFSEKYAWMGVLWSGLFVTSISWILVSNNKMGIYLTVVMLFAAYYFCCGILKNYLIGDLSRKLFLEYLIAALILIAFVWANSYFGQYVI